MADDLYSAQFDFCAEEQAVEAQDSSVAPQGPRDTPGEIPVDTTSKPRDGHVERHALSHAIWALPGKTGEDNKIDISHVIESVSISEEVNKDTDVKLVVANHEFLLTDWAILTEGHRLKIELFDGQDWEDFGTFIIIKPRRNYDDKGTIELDCRSEKVTLQRSVRGYTWRNVRVSDAIRDLARSRKWKAEIEDTPESDAEIRLQSLVMDSTPRQFIERMANRFGWWWDLSGGVLTFKSRDSWLTTVTGNRGTPLTLTYRPDNPEIGSIISANSVTSTTGKKGKKATPRVRSIDFGSGTIGQELIDSIQRNGALGVAAMTADADNADAQEEFYRAEDGLLRTLAEGQADEDPDDGDVLDGEAENYRVPSGIMTSRSAEEAKRVLLQLKRSNAMKYELELETYGRAELRPRTILNVEGLGVEDNGKWLIWKASRKYSNKGYTCTLRLKKHIKARAKQQPAAVAAEGEQTAATTEHPAGIPFQTQTVYSLEQTAAGLIRRESF